MSRKRKLDQLRREIEAKVDDLDARLTETEQHLLERRLAVEPVDVSLLPVLRKRKQKAKR